MGPNIEVQSIQHRLCGIKRGTSTEQSIDGFCHIHRYIYGYANAPVTTGRLAASLFWACFRTSFDEKIINSEIPMNMLTEELLSQPNALVHGGQLYFISFD